VYLDISKERGSVGLGGVESSTLMSKSIVDQLNYARTAKHIDLKLLKKELNRQLTLEEHRQLIFKPFLPQWVVG
jgi:translation initiation factor 2 beta subunit (eIF-2beta)/eIF-5